MRILLTTIIILTLFTHTSCYNDNEEDIYILFSCDTVNVSYTENLKSLFDSRCVSCHNGSHSTCNLNNFDNAHSYAIKPETNLYTIVEGGTHKNQVLTDCEKNQLRLWISTGAY